MTRSEQLNQSSKREWISITGRSIWRFNRFLTLHTYKKRHFWKMWFKSEQCKNPNEDRSPSSKLKLQLKHRPRSRFIVYDFHNLLFHYPNRWYTLNKNLNGNTHIADIDLTMLSHLCVQSLIFKVLEESKLFSENVWGEWVITTNIKKSIEINKQFSQCTKPFRYKCRRFMWLVSFETVAMFWYIFECLAFQWWLKLAGWNAIDVNFKKKLAFAIT